MAGELQHRVEIEKLDAERRIVFGWGYVSNDESGAQVIDHSGQAVSIADIEKAAEGFMLESRIGGQMHKRSAGEVCHSIVITDEIAQALGIVSKKRGWFIGFKVTDDDAWEGVKSRRFRAFSIGGSARKESVDAAA